MKTKLVPLFIFLFTVVCNAQTFTNNFITYEVIPPANNTVKITDYDTNGGTNVTIPASVSNGGNTYDVVEIQFLAFQNKQLSSVSIPNSITTIGFQAFNNNNLSTITIPSSITILQGGVFRNNSLTSVVIPNGVTVIGPDCFINNQLTSVTIPNSVTDIQTQAFQSNALTSIVIPNSVTTLGSSVFANNQITSITWPNGITNIPTQCFSSNKITNLTIPNTVTSIGDNAFGSNTITDIVIPENVTSIGVNAFTNNAIVSVTSLATTPPTISPISAATFGNPGNIDLFIPAGTTGSYTTDPGAQWTGFNTVTELLEVGDTYTDGFITFEVTSVSPNTVETVAYDTAGGTSVTIPDTMVNGVRNYDVTQIGDFSFASSSLTDVIIPTTATIIGQQAFVNNDLANLTIPNTVTEIGQGAFAINALTAIVVPDSVTSLGDSAFENNNLTTATIPDALTTISNNLFSNNNLTSFSFSDNIVSIGIGAFSGNDLTSISLNENLETIGAGAFENNNLAVVNIPESVTTIGNVAFNNNPLTDVFSFAITPPIITTGAGDSFSLDRSTIHLHIPVGTLGVYVTDPGALWTGFNPVSEDILGTSNFELENSIAVITSEDRIKIVSTVSVAFLNYTMYSISGSKITLGTHTEITTNNLAKGVYILHLNFEEGTLVRKVICH